MSNPTARFTASSLGLLFTALVAASVGACRGEASDQARATERAPAEAETAPKPPSVEPDPTQVGGVKTESKTPLVPEKANAPDTNGARGSTPTPAASNAPVAPRPASPGNEKGTMTDNTKTNQNR